MSSIIVLEMSHWFYPPCNKKKTNNGLTLQNQLPVLGKAKMNKRAILLEGQGKGVRKRENNALSDTDNIDNGPEWPKL